MKLAAFSSSLAKACTKPAACLVHLPKMNLSGTSADRETLYAQMLSTAEDIQDYNYRNYFVRRVKQDMQT